MHKVPFVSQRKYALPGLGCGVAATMMLLKFHSRRSHVPSYRDLRKALRIDVPPAEKWPRCTGETGLGTYPKDITAYLGQHGVPHRATYTKSPNQMKVLTRRVRTAPVMVGMGCNESRWGRAGHWIVLIDVAGDHMTYLDPQYLPTHRRPSRMSLADFRRQWDGSSVQIVGFH